MSKEDAIVLPGEVTFRIDRHVGIVEWHRPPNNYFDLAMATSVADAVAALDKDPQCRAIVLCSEGKHFCAGRDFSAKLAVGDTTEALYHECARLFTGSKPLVAAVQGAAVGGGLGLALAADFRIAEPETQFVANFARLGYFPGFGLTVTLPMVVGHQRAVEMLYLGSRIKGQDALDTGLCDRLVDFQHVRDAAMELASGIAASAPLSVGAIRSTFKGSMVQRIREATAHELAMQSRLRNSNDFNEGVRAAAERRAPRFTGT